MVLCLAFVDVCNQPIGVDRVKIKQTTMMILKLLMLITNSFFNHSHELEILKI